MIVADSLRKSFDRNLLWENISFTLTPGIYCFRGPSGCGKTTLGRILAGLDTPNSGRVSGVEGRPAVLFQEPRLLPAVSALDNVACISHGNKGREIARDLLQDLHFTEEDLNKRPHELSGGMQQRVALARLLLFAKENPGNFALLDEPFRGLDSHTKAVAAAMIQRHLTGRITVIITHDESDAALLEGTTYTFDMQKRLICPN